MKIRIILGKTTKKTGNKIYGLSCLRSNKETKLKLLQRRRDFEQEVTR